HPYYRVHRKKSTDSGGQRKLWSHALEKLVFTPDELFTLGAPHRRIIYTAALEAHIDELHEELIHRHLFPVTSEQLQAYSGLSSVLVKSMLSGLQYDAVQLRVQILQLQRAVRSG
ncbi:hypothetical protein C8Q76DRAFT_626734, partial [Earliella scabrosa]